MAKHKLSLALYLCLLGGLFFLAACENELPILHVYDADGNDLLAMDSGDSCLACHADAEYLQHELEVYPVEEPATSEESAGEG